MRLPKSATDYVKVDDEKVKTSIHVMAAKLGLSIVEKEEQEAEVEGGDSQGLDVEEQVLASRRTFNFQEGQVDFKKKRVTDMVTCKRITVPEAAKNGKEAKIQVLINNLEEVLLKSIRDEKRCHRAGGPTRSTMNKRAVRGRLRLLEREKAGELVLVCSDKSGKLYPMSRALYKQ